MARNKKMRKVLKDTKLSKKCNHLIGLSEPRHGEKKFIHYSDHKEGLRWRGYAFFYCPKCGIRQWYWVKHHSKKLGDYKIKELRYNRSYHGTG